MGLGRRCDITAEGASERLTGFSIFNMADYTCILSDLEKVLRAKSCAEFKNFCIEIKKKIGDFTW